MLDEDIFDFLAGSAADASASCGDEGEEQDDEVIPPPYPPQQGHARINVHEVEVLVQTVLQADVAALKDERFNQQNHHEWAPFLNEADDAVTVDPVWWDSLCPGQRADIEAVVRVNRALARLVVPHDSQMADGSPSAKVYRAYVDSFSFSRWRSLRPDAVLIPLPRHERAVLEEVCRRRVLGGSDFLPADLAELSASFIGSLEAGITQVGGRAFAKTAEKSAKNDVDLKPHTTPESILVELTASPDILRQSLGKDQRGQHRGAKYLVLQPWDDDVSRANEFRVIIANRRVVGISQQSWGCCVGHTVASAAAAVQPLLRLWHEALAPACPYSDCILDAFVLEGVGRLIEINPCGLWGSSGSALFHYVHDYDLLFGGGTVLPVRVVVEAADDLTLDLRARAQA